MEVGRLILPNKILPEFIMYTCQHSKITIYDLRSKIFENETSKHINHFIIQYYQVPVKIWVGIQLSDLEEDFIIGALFRSFIQVSSIFYCRACQLFRKQFMLYTEISYHIANNCNANICKMYFKILYTHGLNLFNTLAPQLVSNS